MDKIDKLFEELYAALVELNDDEQLDERAKSSTERVRRYYKRHPEKVRKYLRDTVKDRVARNRDRKKAVKKHGKAKMKNHDVHHPNGPNGGSWRLARKDHGRDKKKTNESIILEGGAHGHLAHPYEDLDLTFRDMEEMLERSLIGNLEKEGPALEKMDGQNIAFTVKDGEVRFARNKGQVKNSGEKSLTADELSKMFGGRGEIYDAFTLASADISDAISSLSTEELDSIFNNGKSFMSTEIIYPGTRNVIPYNKTILVFHGTITYDDDGNNVKGDKAGEDNAMAKKFSDALIKTQATKQKTFELKGPRTISISDKISDDLRFAYEELSGTLERLQSEYGLKPSSTLGDYYRAWGETQLDNIQEREGFKFTNKERNGLLSRWVDGEKSFGVKELSDEKKDWFRQFEKTDLKKMQKQMKRPVETVFLKAGTKAVKRVIDFLSANDPKNAEKLKTEFAESIKKIRESGEESKIQTLESELTRLESLGIDNIIPSEGVIFTYNGNPYKLTGSFAPLNQIMGIMKYNRVAKPETKVDDKDVPDNEPEPDEPTKTEPPVLEKQPPVGVFPGRFQPFHAGHYATYLEMVKKFGKDRVYIVTTDKQDAGGKSPFNYGQKVDIMTKMFDIPEDMIVKVKNPYKADEFKETLPENTPVVFALSEKDKDRMVGKYFKPYDPSSDLKGYSEEGYYWIKPQIEGKQELSGTQIRSAFGNPNIADEAKQEFFTLVYGKFDRDMFDMITKVSTQAEEDRNITATHKEKKKSDDVEDTEPQQPVSPQNVSIAKSVLNRRIKNPDTGRMIYVASALKLDPKADAHKAARAMVDSAIRAGKKQTAETVQYVTENTASDDLKLYVFVRQFNDEELADEVREYFENEDLFKPFPDLAKSANELVGMIKDAPTVTLDTDALKNLLHSNVPEIMRSSAPRKIIQKIAEKDKKSVSDLLHAVKNEEELPMPVVIKFPNGHFLFSGNKRLSILAATGMTMPVKLLNYDKAPAINMGMYGSTEQPVKQDIEDKGKASGKDIMNRILQMKITNPETGNMIKVDTAMDYNKNHPAHKMALNMIRQHMRGVSTRAGIPKNKKLS